MTRLRFGLLRVSTAIPLPLLSQCTFDLQTCREFPAANRQLFASGEDVQVQNRS